MQTRDEFFMTYAIAAAEEALSRGMRPFGNAIVDQFGAIIGTGLGSETTTDPTRHSEMGAIRAACASSSGLLNGCTLYSTHEPCLMCTGAILHAKLSRVVWGSFRQDLPDLFRPLAVGLARWGDTTRPPEVMGGVLRGQCIALFSEELLRLRSWWPGGAAGVAADPDREWGDPV